MVTAVDSSVLLDVLLNDPDHAPISIAAMRQAASDGSLILCEVTLAEVVPTLPAADVSQFLSEWNLAFVPSSQASALLAGEMFRTYLQRGGKRGRVVPTEEGREKRARHRFGGSMRECFRGSLSPALSL